MEENMNVSAKDHDWNKIRRRQQEVKATISVEGYDGDWRDFLTGEVDIQEWGYCARQFGAAKMSRRAFREKCGEIQHTSPEREMLCDLVMNGYDIKELVCEFVGRSDCSTYGICTWIPEHEAYLLPIPEMWRGSATETWAKSSIFHARFITEHDGEQRINFMSTQFAPFHKTMVFHHLVLTPRTVAKAS